MTRDMIKALSGGELAQVAAWAQEEQKERAEKRKQDTIARIRDLARSIDVSIRIEGTRGRPKADRSPAPKARPEAEFAAKPAKHPMTAPGVNNSSGMALVSNGLSQ